jgi:hypothetical protein
MTLNDDDLRELWRERSAQASPGSACLSDGEWTRLLSKAVDAQERLRFATHIASCTVCADEYRLLHPVQAWVADVARLAPTDIDEADRWTGWRAWWSLPGIRVAAAAATVLLVAQGVVTTLLVDSRRSKTQLEAQLAENTQRLSASETSVSTLQERLQREVRAREELAGSQQQREAQLVTPRLDAPVFDLEPQYAGVVRGSSDPQIVTMASGAPIVTFVLSLPPLASRSTLEIEVADASGQIRWMGRAERDQDAVTLTLALPTIAYPAGSYVIRLFDVTRRRTALAVYPVVIRQIPEGSR